MARGVHSRVGIQSQARPVNGGWKSRGLIMEDQLVSFLRSFLEGVEEEELLEDEEERRFFDFPLCFFTFLNYASFTFSF